MKLSLDALQMLDVIDREGSFAAAARQLHRVPSALTHAIRRWEDELGYALFEKQGRRARLTRAGTTLLEQGRTLLRAAGELECRAKRVATGWEVELRIAVEAVIDADALLPLVAEFLDTQHGTRIAIEREVLGGSWDALLTGRADLVIGAAGDVPEQAGLATAPFGTVDMVLCADPQHPILNAPSPVSTDTLSQHRLVTLADTSRSLPTRSTGIFEGQDTLVVPDFRAKLAAQMAGLGIGHLPRALAQTALDNGTLVEIVSTAPSPRPPLYLAWRHAHDGQALVWFREQLQTTHWRQRLLGPPT